MSYGPSLRKRLDKTTLEKLYVHSKLSSVVIASRYGTQPSRILKLLEEYGIPRRSRGAGKT